MKVIPSQRRQSLSSKNSNVLRSETILLFQIYQAQHLIAYIHLQHHMDQFPILLMNSAPSYTHTYIQSSTSGRIDLWTFIQASPIPKTERTMQFRPIAKSKKPCIEKKDSKWRSEQWDDDGWWYTSGLSSKRDCWNKKEIPKDWYVYTQRKLSECISTALFSLAYQAFLPVIVFPFYVPDLTHTSWVSHVLFLSPTHTQSHHHYAMANAQASARLSSTQSTPSSSPPCPNILSVSFVPTVRDPHLHTFIHTYIHTNIPTHLRTNRLSGDLWCGVPDWLLAQDWQLFGARDTIGIYGPRSKTPRCTGE